MMISLLQQEASVADISDLSPDQLRELLGLMSEEDKARLITGHQKATEQLPNGKTIDEIVSHKELALLDRASP